MQQYLPLAVLKQESFGFNGKEIVVQLQQYLPLAVLKPLNGFEEWCFTKELQQYLPLAVLKLSRSEPPYGDGLSFVATVLTACGIETCTTDVFTRNHIRCNSTYRLRY